MILPAQTIRALSASGAMVQPFAERTKLWGMSYGLSSAGYDVRLGKWCHVPVGGFALGSTLECFNMPLDVIGQVCTKSTWARQGLYMPPTVIEPGWRGYLTLELVNRSDKPFTLLAGTPIAQILFLRLEAPTEQPYVGKYQDQSQGPVEAILE